MNGATATQTVFESNINEGDTVVATGLGTNASHIRTIALTNTTVTGPLAGVTTTTVDVLSAGDYILVDNLDYTAFGFYSANTSAAYFTNGVSKTLAEFKAELALVANGSKTATISVVDNVLVTEFRITTASSTASATLASVANPGTAGTVSDVLVTFSKPVYSNVTLVPADFTVKEGATDLPVDHIDAISLATINSTVTLTLATA